MDKMRIFGGIPLHGIIPIAGAKNAALPLMAASLLTDEILTLSNVPRLVDVTTMADLLLQHGVELSMKRTLFQGGGDGEILELCSKNICNTTYFNLSLLSYK